MGTNKEDIWFVKKPCKHCPYRRDVKPFLTPARGAELAYYVTNPYNSFPCHKTTEPDEEDETGERMITTNSLECAGFLSLMHNETGREIDGFEPSDLVYTDTIEMEWAYENEENWKDLQ